MLDYERTFEIKVRLFWTVGQFPKFCLRRQLFAFKVLPMGTRLSNIFKTTSVTNLIKVIQESSDKVLQITSK